jgi:REP element-mobilizing transposase RayT
MEEDCIYHIYNRANGNENLFRESKNYHFFLNKFIHHIQPVAETYAYCLLANHFHAMVRVKTRLEVNGIDFQKYETFGKFVSKQFANCFSAYTQSYNKVYKRTGSLFQPNMKRKSVDSDTYFTRLILYIHNNPVKHGFVKNAWDWPYSSIHHFIDEPAKDSKLLADCSKKLLETSKDKVISWFGNVDEFERAHAEIREVRSVFD